MPRDEFQWPFPGLAEMYAEAKATCKWFHCVYQDLWFSPDELKSAMAAGDFRWGPVNWKLKPPKDQVKYLELRVESAEQELATFKKRVEDSHAA